MSDKHETSIGKTDLVRLGSAADTITDVISSLVSSTHKWPLEDERKAVYQAINEIRELRLYLIASTPRPMSEAPRDRQIAFWCKRNGKMQFCVGTHVTTAYKSQDQYWNQFDYWVVRTPGYESEHYPDDIVGWYELPPTPEVPE